MSLARVLPLLSLSLSVALFAQSAAPSSASSQSTITFTLDYPQLAVSHYEIVLDSTGHGRYTAQAPGPAPEVAAPRNQWGGSETDSAASAEESGPNSNDDSNSADSAGATPSPEGPRSRTFQLRPSLRDQIFALARDADYFRGDFEYRKHKVAFAGTKTLAYAGQGIEGRATFNYSQNASVSRLADIFQSIALELQAEARLRHLLRYDRLGLNQELATLEQSARNGDLLAPQLLTGVLRDIVNNRSVMDLARRRAQHLLSVASSAP